MWLCKIPIWAGCVLLAFEFPSAVSCASFSKCSVARTRFSYCLSTCMLRLFWEVIDFIALESMPSQSVVWPQEGLPHSRYDNPIVSHNGFEAYSTTRQGFFLRLPSRNTANNGKHLMYPRYKYTRRFPLPYPSLSHPSASVSFIHSLHPSAYPNNLPSQHLQTLTRTLHNVHLHPNNLHNPHLPRHRPLRLLRPSRRHLRPTRMVMDLAPSQLHDRGGAYFVRDGCRGGYEL